MAGRAGKTGRPGMAGRAVTAGRAVAAERAASAGRARALRESEKEPAVCTVYFALRLYPQQLVVKPCELSTQL